MGAIKMVASVVVLAGGAYILPGLFIIGHNFEPPASSYGRGVLAGAKADTGMTTVYDPSYVDGGYPPDGRGACSDLIWRSFLNVGYDIKALIDGDIQERPAEYGLAADESDPNIDFRRVRNIQLFLSKYAESLPTEIAAGDRQLLDAWQGGDIVVYGPTLTGRMHIGVVSDTRNWQGIPYIIHNYAFGTGEDNVLLLWPARIAGHYRIPDSGLRAKSL